MVLDIVTALKNTETKEAPEIKVLIATPCYAGLCHANYTLSLVKTFNYFHQIKNVKLAHKFILHESLVPRARNFFVAHALSDPTITHLLFVDADMRWEPEDLKKLLSANKPIIAATFPKKKYIWERLRSPVLRQIVMDDKLSPEEFRRKIKANLVDYAVNFGPSREVRDGIIEVDHAATAFMLIQRETLEKMCAHYPELKVKNPAKDLSREVQEKMYSLFELTVHDGQYFSEDYQFCKLWNQLGGKVYADLTINLGHSGAEEYEGNILAVGTLKKDPL